MVRRMISAVVLSLALASFAPSGVAGAAAYAQDCLSTSDARTAAQNGQIVPIYRLQSEILSAAGGGQIVSIPQLCNFGGHLVYIVNVLTAQGVVKHLTVDASSGSILSQ
jgi:uncharacterized membrane protein YkoI